MKKLEFELGEENRYLKQEIGEISGERHMKRKESL